MVEPLNIATKRKVFQGGLLLLIFAVTSNVLAESLSDPTRPPASLGFAQDANPQAPASGPVLQSVLISSGRKVAIISGQTVVPGGTYGDAKVVNITEGQVTLLSGNNLRTLKLFPSMEKRMTSGRAAPQADVRR
jgi:MSHA biogenesis protein MshK